MRNEYDANVSLSERAPRGSDWAQPSTCKRTSKSLIDHACAVEVPARPRSLLRSAASWVLLLSLFAFIGILMAWRM